MYMCVCRVSVCLCKGRQRKEEGGLSLEFCLQQWFVPEACYLQCAVITTSKRLWFMDFVVLCVCFFFVCFIIVAWIFSFKVPTFHVLSSFSLLFWKSCFVNSVHLAFCHTWPLLPMATHFSLQTFFGLLLWDTHFWGHVHINMFS